MAYSAAMKQAIGAVREQLAGAGFGLADSRFAHHGVHSVDPHAPLVLVACSGGRDSLALAAVAHTVASAWGMRCGAVIVDHGMQPGSAVVAQRAAAQCDQLGLALVLVRTVHVRVGGEGRKRRHVTRAMRRSPQPPANSARRPCCSRTRATTRPKAC